MQNPRGTNPHGIEKVFHPTLLVPDMLEAEDWFRRVFGCASTPSVPSFKTIAETFGMFTVIRDLLIDSISPKRIKELMGIDFFSSEGIPHLYLIGWYVDQDRIDELFYHLKRNGISGIGPDRLVREDPPVQGGDPTPGTLNGCTNFVTADDETGITYQFIPTTRGRQGNPNRSSHVAVDFRLDPGWELPPVDPDDPLGVERCSCHTVLTRNPERVLRFVTDVLGGAVIHKGRNELRGLTSTYVHIGDATFEYAVPDEDGPADADWRTYPPTEGGLPKTLDTYHAITWKVVDIERAAAHLEAQGVRIRARSGDTIITDPATSLGVPWGFTTKPIPGDPRWTA